MLASFLTKIASKLAPTGVVLSAAPRRWGEAGMTDDLLWNKRAVLYSEQFLQNHVSEYNLILCIVSTLVSFSPFSAPSGFFQSLPRPLIEVVQPRHGYSTCMSRQSD